MISQGAPERQDGWRPRAELSELLGTGLSVFERDIRPKLPEGSEQKHGRRLYYHVPSVIATLIKYRGRQVGRPKTDAPTLKVVSENAPESTTDDPKRAAEIEKLRLFNEKQRLNLEAQQGKYIPIEEFESVRAMLANELRSIGGRALKAYGQQVVQVLNSQFETLAAKLENFEGGE